LKVGEVIGYIARTINASEPYRHWSLTPFIVQSVLPLVAPALFAASIYMELGRIVELVKGDHYLFVRRRWMTGMFVTGDVISFLMQGGGMFPSECWREIYAKQTKTGGGLMASHSLSTIRTGENIIVGGLFVQITFFGVFVIAAALFHSRMHKRSTPRGLEVPWQKHMFALYTVSICILIRSIFRVIEFLQGNNGYLMHNEVFLYIFDAMLMLFVMLCMNWVHPSEIRSFLKGGSWTQGFKMKEAPSKHGSFNDFNEAAQ
jgi:RTA1 like protein